MNNHNTLIFVSPENIVKNIERKLSYPFCQLTINSISLSLYAYGQSKSVEKIIFQSE